MKLASHIFLTFACLFLLVASRGFAQELKDGHAHPVMETIQAAYERDEITLEQRVLFKFYAGYRQGSLPDRFKPAADLKVKCGTPAIIDFQNNRTQLSSAAISEIEAMIDGDRLQAVQTYTSDSGIFELHYETSGSDAVPADDSNGNGVPDYVEWTAAAADSSWRHEVGTIGYTDPILPGEPYDIYFKNFNLYGQTVSSGGTTYIEIHNTFENFPENTDPEGDVKGAIKITVAHEFKHAIQYAATQWTGESVRWAEMDATLMEEVVYDIVNDYYNYLTHTSSIFMSPGRSLYPGSYYHVTWALYFEQKYGPFFWQNVWERIKDDHLSVSYIDAVTEELGGAQQFQEDYTTSHLWHYASGPTLSAMNYGFEEREQYPPPTIQQTGFNETLFDSLFTLNLAARYIQISSDKTLDGYVTVRFNRIDSLEDQKIGLGFFATIAGELQSRYVEIGSRRSLLLFQSPWRWDEIDRIQIVVANGSPSQSIRYNLEITATQLPPLVSLGHNYPNPFSSETVLPFSLDELMHVQIKVFDITGRLVRTLLDEQRPAGLYTDINFEPGDLASGVYIYQLITKEKSHVGKMTYIKN